MDDTLRRPPPAGASNKALFQRKGRDLARCMIELPTGHAESLRSRASGLQRSV